MTTLQEFWGRQRRRNSRYPCEWRSERVQIQSTTRASYEDNVLEEGIDFFIKRHR